MGTPWSRSSSGVDWLTLGAGSSWAPSPHGLCFPNQTAKRAGSPTGPQEPGTGRAEDEMSLPLTWERLSSPAGIGQSLRPGLLFQVRLLGQRE